MMEQSNKYFSIIPNIFIYQILSFQVIQDFVGEAMTYLDKLNKEDKLTLLDTLREITEGKMFVEIERARLTEILAKMKEADGNIAEAANIMQEIQVNLIILLRIVSNLL